MGKREKIYGGALWYYANSPRQNVTVRYMIEMKDEVDGEALKRAVDVAMTRYPYLRKKVVATPSEYLLEQNDLPVTVLNTVHPVTLGGKEANGHQFAITYYDNKICFNNTHSIFDGRGRGPVLHTIMYYYCKFRYDEDVQMPGVYLVDTPINPAEYYDPFSVAIPEPAVRIPQPEPLSGVMHLYDMGLVRRTHPQLHHIRINEKQLMSKCKSSDATPNTAISLLMGRAIADVHPDSDKPIVAGVYCDVRKVLNAELSHQCLITTLGLDYSPRMRKLPFTEQNTIFRGKMIIATDPSVLLAGQKAAGAACNKILASPTLDGKIKGAQQMLSSILSSYTFLVSYSGKSSFGSCDKHIAALYPEPGAADMGLIIEVTAADGWFYLSIMQEWCEDVYFNAFLKQLITVGLDFDLLYSSQTERSKFSPTTSI